MHSFRQHVCYVFARIVCSRMEITLTIDSCVLTQLCLNPMDMYDVHNHTFAYNIKLTIVKRSTHVVVRQQYNSHPHSVRFHNTHRCLLLIKYAKQIYVQKATISSNSSNICNFSVFQIRFDMENGCKANNLCKSTTVHKPNIFDTIFIRQF